MTYAVYTSALAEAIKVLGEVAITDPVAISNIPVLEYEPLAITNTPIFFLSVPAREKARGQVEERSYSLEFTLIVHDAGVLQAQAIAGALAEVILDAFDSHITLNRTVARFEGPKVGKAETIEYPRGSGKLYVAVVSTLTLILNAAGSYSG